MKRREMVREKDDDRDADDFQASVDKQGCLGLRGPVVRTLLLVLNSGKTGGVLSSTLQPDCAEGLLSYARLLFAQPQAGKLSILVAAGRQVQTVTSWDPGEQSVEAIVKGLNRKATGDGGCNIKQAIQESLGALFQTSSTNGLAMGIDNKATSVAPKLRKLLTVVRTRLVVVLPCDRVAGDAVHVYHKLVVEALACISMKEHDVESCHAVFLDFSSMLEPAFEPLVTSTATNGDVHLTTTYYRVLLAQALDLFLDLAYFHLELLAIAVKGMVSRLVELSEGDAVTQHGINYKEMKGDKAGAIDSSTRLVIFQSSLLTNNFPTEAPPLHPISIKNARTTVLYCLKSHASTSQLLAMPCTSIAPTLPEVLQRGPSAKLWENLKNHDTGNLVLALSTDEDVNNNNITHLCVWRDGRFWLHTLGLPESRNGATSTAGNDIADEHHRGDNEDSSHPNLGNMLSIAPHRKSSGHHVEKQGGSRHSTKKRKQEEMEENVQVGVAATMRSKKSPTHGSKHLERLSQHFPGTSPDTTLGAPERHSLNLASLVATIRGAFAAEEPLTEHLNNASKCISQLLEFTEKNDLSVFPLTVDSSAVRKELYKKVWVELDSMAKQAKEKRHGHYTHGQEDLANAIFAASTLEPIVIEEKVAPGLPHPVPPEKPSEYAPINKRRRCEEVPRDAHGRPVYPIKLGPSLQVYDLGKIIWNRPNFHSEKYIWPSGYKSRRAYASMLNSENRIFYRCEIVDDGQAPEFRLTPEDDQSNPVVGISATAVWTVVVKRVGALRIEEGGKKTFANVSGPEYFGYANPTIARLIQQLPNAEKCTKYRRQEYLPNVPMRTSGDTEPMHGGNTAVVPPDFPPSPGHETIPHELNTSSSVSGDDSSPVQAAAAAAVGQTFHQESAEGVVGPAQAEDAPPPPPLVNTAEEPCVEGVLVPSPSSTTTTTTTTPPPPPPCKDERLEPFSWLSEFYITRNRKGIGDFPKRFADCNPGSLFNHYWSAKLRRLQTFELDGRK